MISEVITITIIDGKIVKHPKWLLDLLEKDKLKNLAKKYVEQAAKEIENNGHK